MATISTQKENSGDPGKLGKWGDIFRQMTMPLAEEARQQCIALQDSEDPEVLHRLRVALRRLRTMWWTFLPRLACAGGGEPALLARTHIDLLRQWASAAGATRDWDVLTQLLTRSQKRRTREALMSWVCASRADALAKSRAVFAEADVAATLVQWIDGTAALIDHCATDVETADGADDVADVGVDEAAPSDAAVRQFLCSRVDAAKRQLKRRQRKVLRQRGHRARLLALHEVRKASKKVRYLMMSIGPVIEQADLKGKKRFKKMQTQLGLLNDIVASVQILKTSRKVLPKREKRHADGAISHFRKEAKRRATEITRAWS